jgi:hypothetical protein
MFCYNCEKSFPVSELVQRRDGEAALHIYCCPHCGADNVGEGEECKICGRELAEGETSGGYCLPCLWEQIDYDVALAYMKELGGSHLAEFLLNDWFDGSVHGTVSDKLNAFLEESFRRIVADEKLRLATDKYAPMDFLTACRSFCLPEYPTRFGSNGQEFAEWYAGRSKND